MTKAQTIPAIMMVNYCPYVEAKFRNENIAYYTKDAEDALNTAKYMNEQYVHSGRI